MCEYCNKSYGNKNMVDDEYRTIEIDNGNIEINYYDSMYYMKRFKINYCPMCGGKITKEEVNG